MAAMMLCNKPPPNRMLLTTFILCLQICRLMVSWSGWDLAGEVLLQAVGWVQVCSTHLSFSLPSGYLWAHSHSKQKSTRGKPNQASTRLKSLLTSHPLTFHK